MSYLNTNAQVKYQDMQIDADYIQIDWDKGMIYARGKVDSTGKIVIPAAATPVSYTHLDVYKRQVLTDRRTGQIFILTLTY